MAYVISQSCCSDASCVVACPVNCIHPAPGDPGFATAEMLYIDASSCVGCGACVTACPVGAISPDTLGLPEQQPFIELAAEYFAAHPHADRPPLALVPPQRRIPAGVAGDRAIAVAVVGAGPAGLYAADELLTHPEVCVDVFDRLPVPHGLARYGVAPDHTGTRQVARLFDVIAAQPGFTYRLGVEVGRDVTLADLQQRYDAVVFAVGAASDRRLGIEGEDLRNSVSATDLVAWYNGHPDATTLALDLDTPRAVVIGNGNVALDVARILTADPETLAGTAIGGDALEALRGSGIEEVVVLGRRGAEHAAFTTPELIGLAGLPDVDVLVEGEVPGGTSVRARLLADLASRRPTGGRRRIVLRFHAAPERLLAGARGVRGLRLTDGREIDAGLVVRAIGYRGIPVAGLPYDDATGAVPHERGRVRPGVYVVGWAKRGPTGFLGSNKSDAHETVASLLDDLESGAVRPRRRDRVGLAPGYAAPRGQQEGRAAAALGRS